MTDECPADDMRYRRLSDLPALEVADDSLDVRGWDVSAAGGRIGKVADLLVDADQLTTVCLLVEPAPSVAPPDGSLYLVPVDTTELIPATQLVATPLDANQLTLTRVGSTDAFLWSSGAGARVAKINLQYRSTNNLLVWGVAVVALIALVAWLADAIG